MPQIGCKCWGSNDFRKKVAHWIRLDQGKQQGAEGRPREYQVTPPPSFLHTHLFAPPFSPKELHVSALQGLFHAFSGLSHLMLTASSNGTKMPVPHITQSAQIGDVRERPPSLCQWPQEHQEKGGRGSRPSTKRVASNNHWLPNQPVHDLQLTCSGVAVVYVLPRKRRSPQTPQVRRMTPFAGITGRQCGRNGLQIVAVTTKGLLGVEPIKKEVPSDLLPFVRRITRIGSKKYLSQSVQAPI